MPAPAVDDAEIRLVLPGSAVPTRRRVLRLDEVALDHGPTVSLEVVGPERIALVGANGSGKTTLLRTIARGVPTSTGTANEIRARLAQLLFRGARADQLARGLSGGERLRATLATLLLAEPAPQLLLLDEPTNNLDMASVGQLTGALASHSGALIVVSHDLPFLRDLEPTRWLELTRYGLVEQ